MNRRQTLCLLLCVCAPASFAASGHFHPPMRLDDGVNLSDGVNLNLSGIDVFDAFHFKMRQSQLTHQTVTPLLSTSAIFPLEFRSIDGSGNNQVDPLRGATNTPLLRNTTIAYGDGQGTPAGADQKGAREISNLVVAQAALIPNTKNVSDFIWQWGQFLDHDMSLTPVASPSEGFSIPVPTCDPVFDPSCTGTEALPFKRSLFVLVNGVRQPVNVNTTFIDGSQVYGSDQARAQELRMLDGSGKLKTSDNNLLPFNVNAFPNEPSTDPTFFLAGDVRVNETAGLTALQTLFMREHNFWADSFKNQDPTLDDDGIYLRARAMVGAEIEVITYRDLIPLLLGTNALAPYAGYNPDIEPRIANVFSTAAFRVGHTLLSQQLLRLDASNQSIGDLSLHDSFFRPVNITGPGIEPYLRGLAKQRAQHIDAFIVDGVRNFTSGARGGFDLASLNIQRGRDHGLPRYNQVRIDYGLRPVTKFSQITGDTSLQAKLASAYLLYVA